MVESSTLTSEVSVSEKTEELQEIEQELVSANPEMVKVLNGLGKNKREVLLKSASIVMKQHSGPLPDPETLSDYNNLIENGAERIMRMAEKQQDHTNSMEKLGIRRFSFQYLLGQLFAFCLASATIWFGYDLTTRGYENAGIAIFSTTVIAILSKFLFKRSSKTK
jgi:uncharacterized membrane protein